MKDRQSLLGTHPTLLFLDRNGEDRLLTQNHFTQTKRSCAAEERFPTADVYRNKLQGRVIVTRCDGPAEQSILVDNPTQKCGVDTHLHTDLYSTAANAYLAGENSQLRKSLLPVSANCSQPKIELHFAE